jgi:hypothetical protein
MPTSAHDVAAVICSEPRDVPVSEAKLHFLLYLCQGHHLADHREPLFPEEIEAWDHGPVVPDVWNPAADRPSNLITDIDRANTIGYVNSRYQGLSSRELALLCVGADPYKRADRDREPGRAKRIETAWILEYFTQAKADDTADLWPPLDPEEVRAFLAKPVEARQSRGDEPVQPESVEAILAWKPKA